MLEREAQAQKHLRITRQFLDASDRLFDEGDIVQTSEKLWGATVHAVKVLCFRREWRHNRYAFLYDAVKRLSEEIGDPTLPPYFKVAQGNHVNFYDDFITSEAVDEDRQTVRELIGKILTAAGENAGDATTDRT